MRGKKIAQIVVLLLEIIAISLYIIQLGGQAPVKLSFFSQADLHIIVSGKTVYHSFILGMVMFQTVCVIGKNCNAMQLLLWQTKKKLLCHQLKLCVLLDLIIAAIIVVIPMIYGAACNKTGINWGSSSSYFCVLHNQILPNVTMVEVVLVHFGIQFLRNMIFSLMILIGWWSDKNMIYSILVMVGVCIIELRQPNVRLLMNLVKADYEFWLSGKEKMYAIISGCAWILAEIGILFYLKKRKELL